jgi:DNA-directed RNA polymerase subunit RPC12/RpoP
VSTAAARRGGDARDAYTPDPADTATCPHCGHQVGPIPSDYARIEMVTLFGIHCPACGGEWGEVRMARVHARHWSTEPEPDPAA